MHICACCCKRGRPRLRAGKAKHLVSVRNQLADDGRADKASGAGNENTHIQRSSVDRSVFIRLACSEKPRRYTGIPTNRLSMSAICHNQLGTYLRDRRAKLDPEALGISSARRRTPGLRREEVAQRANISATWYTWLEQGRGGVPASSPATSPAGDEPEPGRRMEGAHQEVHGNHSAQR